MKLIGIEEHFLTGEIRDAWHAIGLEAIDPSVAYHAGAIEQRLFDLAEDLFGISSWFLARREQHGRMDWRDCGGLHICMFAFVACQAS